MKNLLLVVLVLVSGCCGRNDEALTVAQLHTAIAAISGPLLSSDGTPYMAFEQLNHTDWELTDEELGHRYPHLTVSGQPLDWNADDECYYFAGTEVKAMWMCSYEGDTLTQTHLALVTRKDGEKWQQFDPISRKWIDTEFSPPAAEPLNKELTPGEGADQKPKIKAKSVAFIKPRLVTTIFISDFGTRKGRPFFNGNNGQLAVVIPVYLEGETSLIDQDLLRLAQAKSTVELEFNLQFTQRNDLRIVRRVTKQ